MTVDEGTHKGMRLIGPDGNQVPMQTEFVTQMSRAVTARILFLARVPSLGFAVYHLEPTDEQNSDMSSELKVTQSSLENARYKIEVNSEGDVTRIFDKKLERELLSAPMRLAFQSETPLYWPAWNMDWADQSKPPRDYVRGPAKITIVELGPVRVALRIEREAEDSKFVETIRLSAGDAGNHIEFANAIDWKARHAALKATFPLTASNENATYNWGAGTIERPTDNEKTFEMASHRWFDLTDQSGDFGVTILSGAKTGSDKPSANTLRLTLLYTPGINDADQEYRDQGTQDWGHHEFVYGLTSHAGSWQSSNAPWQAYRLDDPLIAFQAVEHAGTLGNDISLLKVSSDDVRVMAFKKAEQGDDAVVRVVEMSGKAANGVRLKFAAPVARAREVNGQELPMGAASVANGELVVNLKPYEIKSYAVRLAPPPVKVSPPVSRVVALRYDLTAATNDGAKPSVAGAGFDDAGDSYAAEMLPARISYSGVEFQLAHAATGAKDAVVARGQTIDLPAGNYNRVYILAAADGDQSGTFRAVTKREI